MWLTLQDQDPEVPVTDDDSALIPLTWRVQFVDGNAMDRQISKIGNDITIFDVLSYILDAIIDELYAARIVHSHLNATTRTTSHYGPSRVIMAAGIEAVETQGLAKIDEVTHRRVLVDLLSLDKIAVSRTLCISITMIVAKLVAGLYMHELPYANWWEDLCGLRQPPDSSDTQCLLETWFYRRYTAWQSRGKAHDSQVGPCYLITNADEPK
ncbi:hypothetical protein D6C90_10034 [Aureobasidium pullulans]|uniref:Uncharacterized protein n=1 Tax=Aureobasidium pullulans TaxID=5580 RepID=A0A4S9SVS4_AURPU|nr:hypothetical protein D6C90_10034 [Aureobasidium pullulans]